MDRRTFLCAATAPPILASFATFAQQSPRIWRIGFLSAYTRQYLIEYGFYTAFLQAMHKLGYVQGRNLVVDERFADGQYDRLPALAAELVRLNVDVIVAAPSPAIRAAQKSTAKIPIVFPSTGDPVGSGFVASLAHPGGNLTGMSNSNLDVSAKTLELLLNTVPSISRVAVLANPGSSTAASMLRSIGTAAQTRKVQMQVVEARTPEEILTGFATMRREHADALFIAGDAVMAMQRHEIADLAIKEKLPSVSQGRSYARDGGLLSYGQDLTENYRLAATYVDKILRGAKPADLPVEQPTKLELIINLKTAKALGLTIPQAVLLRADEVIQ